MCVRVCVNTLYYVADTLSDQYATLGPSFVSQPAEILYQVLDRQLMDDIDYDDTVTFKCEATGFPEPRYEWYTRINDNFFGSSWHKVGIRTSAMTEQVHAYMTTHILNVFANTYPPPKNEYFYISF